jgi:hypothetical protein
MTSKKECVWCDACHGWVLPSELDCDEYHCDLQVAKGNNELRGEENEWL